MLRRDGLDRLVPVAHAAVVKNAYTVRLQDGTITDTMEQALGLIETKAIPMLASLPDRWPLDRPDRKVLTEYLAVQLARTPDSLRRHGRLVAAAVKGTEHESEAGLDSLRMRAMVAIKDHAMTLLSGMHWTLLAFKQPCLTTSDHPVAMFPLDLEKVSDDLGAMSGNLGEAWFAVTSRLLLVLAWRDREDTPTVRSGLRRVAESHNAAMRDQAEGGWFWHPSVERPPVASADRIASVGELLFAGYGPDAINRSAHRAEVYRHLANPSLQSRGKTTVFFPNGRTTGLAEP